MNVVKRKPRCRRAAGEEKLEKIVKFKVEVNLVNGEFDGQLFQ